MTVNQLLPGLFDEEASPKPANGTDSDPAPKTSESDEQELYDMLERLIRTNQALVPELMIDDSDLPPFKNFYDFCFSPMGMQTAPFARQMVIALQTLAEWCPDCSRKSRQFNNIRSVPVDYPAIDFPEKIQLLEYGRCPKCGATKGDLFKSGSLNHYTELAALAGQRSGKSSLMSLIAPYLIHRWLKVDRPVEALGLMQNSLLVGTFVGLTFAKAVELLWTPIYNAILGCTWFREYHKMLDHYGKQHGEQLVKLQSNSIQYPYKNIIFSPSGPNKRTLRGPTRIMSLIDEIGWFPHGDENETLERASANEVYTALSRSLKTVQVKANRMVYQDEFAHLPNAYMGCISSPSSYWDKISTLVRSNRSSKDVYTCHLATWQMNPEYKRSDFDKEFAEDPIKARRDFGAQAPMATNPWIGDVSNVVAKCANGRKPKVTYRYQSALNRNGTSERYAELGNTRIASDQVAVLAIDAGYTKNSFALALMHAKQEPKLADVRAVIEVAPGTDGPLNYARLGRELIYPLIDTFNVRLVLADRWQSLKLLSDIELDYRDLRVGTMQYSLKPKDFDLIRDYLVEDSCDHLRLPPLEVDFADIMDLVDPQNYPECFRYKPGAHLLHQLMSCNVDARGVVEKSNMATDDLVRALCLGLWACSDKGIVKEYGLLGKAIRDDLVVAVKHGTRNGSSIALRMDDPAFLNPNTMRAPVKASNVVVKGNLMAVTE